MSSNIKITFGSVRATAKVCSSRPNHTKYCSHLCFEAYKQRALQSEKPRKATETGTGNFNQQDRTAPAKDFLTINETVLNVNRWTISGCRERLKAGTECGSRVIIRQVDIDQLFS